MGIPVYFKQCIQDYTSLCLETLPTQVDYLYLDTNCLIHPCCRGETEETQMIENIIQTIDHIYYFVKPKSLLYIAIDGPCPKPKLLQQRSRRFLSCLESKPWDTNAITPGTRFMNTLETKIQVYCQTLSIQTQLDGCLQPGEGEHKIFDHLKHHKDTSTVVYGLDADLIMLSMLSPCQTIYLLRETTEYNIEQCDSNYIFLDIASLQTQICQQIRPSIYAYSNTQLILDYSFICFLLGNDFVKPSPSLHLRYGGLHEIQTAYKSLCESSGGTFRLVDQTLPYLVCLSSLIQFLTNLCETETKRLSHILHIRTKQERKMRQVDKQTKDKRDMVVHTPILQRTVEKQIFQDMSTWKPRYYAYVIHHEIDSERTIDLQRSIRSMSRQYVESILWTLHYYLQGCSQWDFSYDYHYAPSLEDVIQSLKQDEYCIQNHSQPIEPEIQLQTVLPLQSHHLLTKPFKPDPILYPQKPQRCYLLKRYMWECELWLPKL